MIDPDKRPSAKDILNDPWLAETSPPKIIRSHSN